MAAILLNSAATVFTYLEFRAIACPLMPEVEQLLSMATMSLFAMVNLELKKVVFQALILP